ncbi:hypothetical protein H4219_004649 [Mycoemilia scoparia]|uniref:Proteasome maturation protein n=1 Tax=Mycoemilia scoparia TaxID=417184 RepID=A0A9W8DRJ0_9FUNG|nr:hypothetical protein H4219_004649 [Mycoemilia scoparia]
MFSQTKTRDNVTVKPSATSYGAHDVMRNGGPFRVDQMLVPRHELEGRLENWEESQEQLFMNTQRRVFGLHMPLKKMMEKNIIMNGALIPGHSENAHFNSQVTQFQMDILSGDNTTIDVKDVFNDASDEPYVEIPTIDSLKK